MIQPRSTVPEDSRAKDDHGSDDTLEHDSTTARNRRVFMGTLTTDSTDDRDKEMKTFF